METDTEQITSPMAVAVCAQVHLEKASRKLLRDDLTAIAFIRLLADTGSFGDAVRVLAHLLPQRESVWWACQCARQTPLPDAPPELDAAVLAAEKWVAEMTEESRRAAGDAGKEAEISTAAGCAAYAAFSTGGSISPPDAQPVAPPPGLTAQYVAASILISALVPNPEAAPDKYRLFIAQGIEQYKSVTSQQQSSG